MVNNCDIIAEGQYVGGMVGYFYQTARIATVVDTDITGTTINSNYIGGIAGYARGCTVYNFQIDNTNIESLGNTIGGVIGENEGSNASVYNGYLNNVNIEGSSYIGGIIGTGNWLNVTRVYVSSDIVATVHTAGGVVGYLDNSNMSASRYVCQILEVMSVDSSITAPSKAGGLIGDISAEIYRDKSFYYNNYIDADVTSENESTGSLIIGGRSIENQYITNTYIYKYSTLNGDYVYATNDNVDEDQLLVRADLDAQSTFQNKIGLQPTYWNFESIQNGKYPTIKDTYLYYPELQTEVDLPTDPEIVDINSLDNELNTNQNNISTQSIKALPEVIVYPISVNEINIDFSSIPEGVSFTYYINGSEIETIDLTEKTYTVKYNFRDSIKIVVNNGVDEENITFEPTDIRSEISLIGSNYAYLIGNNLYINGELQSGEYVNVYSGYALNSSGQVLEIKSGELIENGTTETSLEESTKPLHTYEYKENSIEVFGTYSKIDGNVKLQIYNVRSGKLSAISNNLDMKIDNYIVDNYNDKEYQTILTNSGEIVDLKEGLKYPSNFLNRNVKQIVQNSSVDNTEMMVLYNTGKVIVFNYVNGNIIYENSEQADSGLANYITGSISSIWSDYENKQSEYLRSKALIVKLAEMPIEKVLEDKENSESNINSNNSIESINNVNIDNITEDNLNTTTTSNNTENYITVYNGETGEYEVYSESEILEGSEEMPVSETEKIKENGLEGIYNYEQEEETTPQVNGALIVVSIIVIAIISLVILRKLIYRNNQSSTKK